MSSSNRQDPIKKLKSAFIKPTFSQTGNPNASSSNFRPPGSIASQSGLINNLNRLPIGSGVVPVGLEEVGGSSIQNSVNFWNVQWRNFQAKKHKTWDR